MIEVTITGKMDYSEDGIADIESFSSDFS